MSNSTPSPPGDADGPDGRANGNGAENGADSTGDDTHDQTDRATAQPGSVIDRLVGTGAVTREQLAKWYYAAGLTFREIADKLDVDHGSVTSGSVSYLMRAYGLSPGEHNQAEEWVISRLPYPWAAALRAERGINAVARDEMYDASLDADDVPTLWELQQAHYGNIPPERGVPADVPVVYALQRGDAGRLGPAHGLDVAQVHEFVTNYTPPDPIPDAGVAGPDDRPVLAPDTPSARAAALLLVFAASADTDGPWSTSEIAAFILADPPAVVDSALGRLAAVHVADPYPPSETGGQTTHWGLYDDVLPVLAGKLAWEKVRDTPPADDASVGADADSEAVSATAGEPEPDPITMDFEDLPPWLLDADAETVTPSQLADLYYGLRWTYKQMASELGTTTTRVGRLMRDAGLNPGKRGEREDRVVEVVAELDTTYEISPRDVAARMEQLRSDAQYVAMHGSRGTGGTESDQADADEQATADSDGETMSHSRTDKTDGGELPSGANVNASAADVDFEVLPDAASKDDVEKGTRYWAKVNNTKNYGVFVSLNNINRSRGQVNGLIPRHKLRLYDPNEFVPGEDELVVELFHRKDDGKLDFKPIRWLTKDDDGSGVADTDDDRPSSVGFDRLDQQLGDVADVTTASDTADTEPTTPDETGDADADAADDTAGADTAAEAEVGEDDAVEGSARVDMDGNFGDVECVCDRSFDTWSSFAGHRAQCNEWPEGQPARAALTPPVVAKLYYHYGLPMTGMAEIYAVADSEFSKALTAANLSPGKGWSNVDAVLDRLRDEYDWAVDLAARGSGRPDGAARDDPAVYAALFADPDVPNPTAIPDDVRDALTDEYGIGAEVVDAAEGEPELSLEYYDVTADDTSGIGTQPTEVEADVEAEADTEADADTDSDTEDDTMPDTTTEQTTAPARNHEHGDAFTMPRKVFEQEVREVAEDLSLAPEGSEMYMMVKGRERVLRRLAASAETEFDVDAVLADAGWDGE